MKKYLLLLIMLLFLGFVGTGFAQGASEKEYITLGHLNAFTGAQSLFGFDGKRSIILAIEEINGRGGINVKGKRYLLKCIHLDNKYDPGPAISAYRRLVDLDGVRFILCMGTMAGAALIDLNEKDKVLLDILSTSETTTVSGNKLVVNPVARSNGYEPPVVREAIRRGMKTMCIIADDSESGRDYVKYIVPAYKKLGGEILDIEYVKASKGVDFMMELTKIKAFNPDCLYILAMEEPNLRMAKQAREAGIKAKLLFNVNFKQKVVDGVGINNLEGTLFAGSPSTLISTAPPGTPEIYLKYRDRYLKRWPGEYISGIGPFTYHWAYYITRAMELAGTITDVYKVRQACNKAMAETRAVMEFEGLTKGGRAYGQEIYVMGIEKGQVRVISAEKYPKELAGEGEK